MNGDTPKVEIFAPFGEAYELMKRILFQPFHLEKWLVIAFAAFLSHLAGGGGSFNYNRGGNKGDWSFHSSSYHPAGAEHHFPLGTIVACVILVPLVLAILGLLLWLGARGKFIFTDCIVRNRAAIREPWREYRPEANSLFRFMIVAAVGFIVVMAAVAAPFLLQTLLPGNVFISSIAVADLFFVAALAVLIIVVWGVAAQLMVPIMYRQRCGAVPAFREVLALISTRPVPIILLILFQFVIAIAIGVCACLITCATCCITAIPYVGTVIFLPIYVWMTAFTLLFLRQFGERCDVWAGVAPAVIAVPPVPPDATIHSAPPPIQPEPPLTPEPPIHPTPPLNPEPPSPPPAL